MISCQNGVSTYVAAEKKTGSDEKCDGQISIANILQFPDGGEGGEPHSMSNVQANLICA